VQEVYQQSEFTLCLRPRYLLLEPSMFGGNV
jgi:hypothetical protein